MPFLLLLRRLGDWMSKRVGWGYLFVAMAIHLATTYVVLRACGETHITDVFANFLYWYVTTTTTVGYGDLSPQSPFARYFTAIWVMLGGIGIITAVIGTCTANLIDKWRNRLKGNMDYSDLAGHTLVVGWKGASTLHLLEMLLAERGAEDAEIVLCADGVEENPLPNKILFVRSEGLGLASLLRGAPGNAKRIIVHGANDDQTLAVALAIGSTNYKGHMVAHFDSSERAALAKSYLVEIEVCSPMTADMLVRSANDPGTSSVVTDLLDASAGAGLFTLVLAWDAVYRDLINKMQAKGAIAVGFSHDAIAKPAIAPPETATYLRAGAQVYYIAQKRITQETLQ
ncbi:voltage-gated potassium channel [Pseudomonas nitritireducens]|uniref:Voltage-gated potassium channel n=1 Tax=Pseudomonas nitroreducens TaxID=46680 RepID=A0A7W7KPY3_PSENT|nr:ion channel [Pseudomonas nitritireducens]MBB4866815.1 voltage-gated potassium channel [Pseudomonas nitritireducens]